MSDATTLRTAGPADAAAIHELVQSAYAKWLPIAARPPLPMTVDYDVAVKAHRFDLLFVGDRLAALIETTPQGGDLLIVNVAVRPDQQGRGHGVRLLRLAEDLAAEAGLAGLRLYTNKLFTENIRLYASLGYAIESEDAANGGVRVNMRKPRA
ncbi:MAG: GNAT family N-acetyltransferase [Phenylobacterium sp.]|uniref:GNAT family N-acetyltransferase n=1 Tax=Phenylobacterium sp. TaxID=1871053 RepID=UPI0025E957D9|nr:GNAT family N-acetyltransferase [Phenylobacterium sp.]MBI1200030.1 GNAT family N-acetyltransferase [Phenylobacterium sp.]